MTQNATLEDVRREAKSVFRVYDMPASLEERFISYAKKNSYNKGWLAIDQLLNHANLSERLVSIEERLGRLEARNNGKI